MLPIPQLYPTNTPNPFTFREVDLRFVLSSPHLAALRINPFSAASLTPQHLASCVLGKQTWFGNIHPQYICLKYRLEFVKEEAE